MMGKFISKLVVGLVVGTSAVAASTAARSETAATVSVRAEPTTRGGELISCSLIFNVLGKDHRYMRGGDIAAVGNFSVYSVPESPAGPIIFGLKLSIYDYIGSEYRQARIAQTHLIASDGTVWKGDDNNIFDGESPGTRLHALFLGPESEKFMNGILRDRRFGIGFNRESGATDVNIYVDLEVESINEKTGEVIRSPNALLSFIGCMKQLIDMSLSKMKQ